MAHICRFFNCLFPSKGKEGVKVVYSLYMYPRAPSNDLCLLLSFSIGRSINPIEGGFKMDQSFGFSLETGNRWTFHRTHFTDRIYNYFSYFSSLASYSKFAIFLFLNVGNVKWPNRIIFFSRPFAFFHHVGIRINSCLLTLIHVGRKKTPVLGYKVYFVHCRRFHFSLNRSSRYGFIWFQGTNIRFRKISKSIISCSIGNNILFWFSYCLCCQIADDTPTYMVTRYPRGSTLQYMYAFSWNLIKDGSIWIDSDQYGIISSCSFKIVSLVSDSRNNTNPLCSFNLFRSTQFKKRIAYSSVSHMGFIIIGIGSITSMGLNGAILQILSHGLIGAALFFLGGTCWDRIRFVYLEEMGGISIPMPKIFTMFSSFSMASLALPGMSGFVAELLVFFGIITSPKYLLMPKMLMTFVMAIGMILTPIFLLSMLRQIFYGYKLFNVPNSNFFDSGPRELFVSICMFLPVIGIGIYPDFVFPLSVDKVQVILSNYFYRY
uniref:NADH dehydrogenase subunit D n=1 Tax=Gymnadenia crassinervis TaxID=329323 RepID=A0A8F5DPX7_9ASPA|nr:NADH dehydrogenase subunit D [Gymnadenia crassinervis]